MKFVIDLDTLALTEAAKTAKRGDASPFEVTFARAGIAEDLPDNTLITFIAKAVADFEGDAVVLANDFTRSEIGTDAKYLAGPSFNTAELNALFAADGAALDHVDLIAEFSWSTSGGLPTSTKTFFLRVDNDIFQSGEGTPTSLPTPDDWLEERRPAPLALTEVPVSGYYYCSVDPAGLDNSLSFISKINTPIDVEIVAPSAITEIEVYLTQTEGIVTRITVHPKTTSTAQDVINFLNGVTDVTNVVEISAGDGSLGLMAATTGEVLWNAPSPVPAAIGQSAIVTHSDSTKTEWGAVSLTEWLPRTAGIIWSVSDSAWRRQTLASDGTAEYELLPNQ